MSGSPRRYCGRDFSEDEVDMIRGLIARGGLHRRALSREVCRRLDWRKPDGGLKDMSARVAMLRMHRDGVIVLPPPRRAPVVRRPLVPGPATDRPPFPTPERLADIQPVAVEPVRNAGEGRLWNEFVARYHYLGYSTLPGAQMRYFVRAAGGEPLAVLGFGAAAWKIAPRDKLVGWDPETRRRNLPLVVNNARFLILPWVRIKNLASCILAMVECRLPDDWEGRYALRPALMETFCESTRFEGTCYRAANWTKVGKTQGRGKLDTRKERALPVKDIWLKPLRRDWRRLLNE